MKVLSVGSLGKDGRISPFRREQGEAFRKKGIHITYFNIEGRGLRGYLKSRGALGKFMNKHHFDIIHAHYGLSGMVCASQRKCPVVITFHGSDIWNPRIRMISRLASYLSAWNIYVSENLKERASGFRRKRTSIIPCGVDLQMFYPIEKAEARKLLEWKDSMTYILFPSSRQNPVKNYSLAEKATASLPNTALIELQGYERKTVNLLMNACDLLLVTSLYESGPLVVKEAMACNLPILSTDVGDVRKVLGETEGCFIVDYDASLIEMRIKHVLRNPKRTAGRGRVHEFDIDLLIKDILDLYRKILKPN